MRLINATTLEICEFLNEAEIPPFAILSHTWEAEEFTLQQMQNPEVSQVSQRLGYKKIELCCKQALKNDYKWAWVDTCCIDKTSTAELPEAINSMFRWYRKAQVCYVYLKDVTEVGLARSRWFTRGWTLQELVAPANVWFFTVDWQYLGSKEDLKKDLTRITGIEAEVLSSGSLQAVSIARRMSWAAKRQTTRIEDQAYSLMGIFDVNMPLLYGEGKKAFIRLQEEIMKITGDQSLFAWGLPPRIMDANEYSRTFRHTTPPRGLFAESPSEFTNSDRIHVLEDLQATLPPIVSSNGVRIELQLKQMPKNKLRFAVVYCTMRGRLKDYIGIPVVPWEGRRVVRCGELVSVPARDLLAPDSNEPYCKPTILFIKGPPFWKRETTLRNTIKLVQIPTDYSGHYRLNDVHCAPHATYAQRDQTLTLTGHEDALHAVLFYDPVRPVVPELIHLFTFPQSWPAWSGHKIRLENMIHATRDDGYRFQVCDQQKNSYEMTQMPFAILVGGARDDPWLKIMILLDETNRDDDFHALLATDKRLVQSCITKSQLLSLLAQSGIPEPLARHRSPHQRQLTMHCAWELSTKPNVPNGAKTYARMEVDAQVRLVSSNLVERSLVLFVAFLNERNQTVLTNPNWWEFRDLET